ncbi:MAG TPA: hypothetical protein VF515_19450 [Candidatus Binatia bacterium]
MYIAGGNGVGVHYLQPSIPARQPNLANLDLSTIIASGSGSGSSQSAPLATASGDIEGNGASDLVVGQSVRYGQGPRDGVEVYRIVSGLEPELLAHLAAFDNTGTSNSGNLAAGDVDPSEPGDEIVVGEDGSCRRAARLRIFGGLASGNLHLLHELRALPSRSATRQPVSFVLGNVFPDADHPGQEIVVGGGKGDVYVYGVSNGRAVRLQRFLAFPDRPHTSAHKIAVGDVLADNPGEEIIVADDGRRQDGLVRVFDGRTGKRLLEFEAFERGQAPAGVELWAADTIAALPGAELIVGQGRAGGRIRVFTLAGGVPKLVLELPDPLHRATSLSRLLAIGHLVPDLDANQIAVAQADSQLPVQVFDVKADGADLLTSVNVSGDGQIGAITVGH